MSVNAMDLRERDPAPMPRGSASQDQDSVFLAQREFHPFEAGGETFLYLVPSAAVFHLDETSLAVLTILVEGGTITAVEAGFADPEDGDTLIDLSTHTVLPGLMDMHVHLTS